MRKFRIKLAALALSAALLSEFVLQCDKGALNLQRGFWAGLGDAIANLVVPEHTNTAP